MNSNFFINYKTTTMASISSVGSVASRVSFNELAGLMEKLSRQKGMKKCPILTDFIKTWRNLHSDIYGTQTTTDSFFSAMRLLIPQHDRSRAAYGIKENVLAKKYIEILCLGKDSVEAQKLLNFKNPKNAVATTGDFANTAYFILKNRCPEKGTLTIEEVNNHLSGISVAHLTKKPAEVNHHLLILLKNLSAQEQKWLIRIILRELKCGISEKTIFTCFHEDAEAYFDVTQSLEKVCSVLHDPKKRLHEISVALNTAFRPMLGDNLSMDKFNDQVSGEFVIEIKHDGERVQLHKDLDGYRYWSRSGNEWTSTYGCDSETGTLTPFISKAFLPSVTSCILDGEMMGFNLETQVMGTKAQDFDVKRVMSGYVPCFIVFDILLLNGRVLTNLSLVERKKILDKQVFVPIEGRMHLSKWNLCNSKEECIKELNDAIDAREEGLMVKRADSVYSVGNRKGGWFKLKPEFIGNLSDDIDCVIVGGYFGSGHRAGLCSHFLCALAVPPQDSLQKPTEFHSFCKVGSGYSKQTLYDFNLKMAPNFKKFNRKSPPTCFELATGLREKPDLWIDPKLSYIVQIKAAEIINSDAFRTGFTLRFPRVVKFRDDKEWHDCATVTDVAALKGGLANRHYVEGDQGPKTKKRKVQGRFVKATVGNQFLGVDPSSVKVTDEIFESKEFCILSGPEQYPKLELERRVLELAGSVVQNPSKKTLCVVAAHLNLKVKNIIKSENYDVVMPEWLIQCLEQKKLLPFRPLFMHFSTSHTAKSFQARFDRYGDSYTEATDPGELYDLLMKVVPTMQESELDQALANKVSLDLLPDDTYLGPLRPFIFYVDQFAVLGDQTSRFDTASCDLKVLCADIKRLGGVVTCDFYSLQVTHIVFNTSDLSRLSIVKTMNNKRGKRWHLVTEKWVQECLKHKIAVPERPFLPS